MSDYITKRVTVAISGYVRGNIEIDAFYNKDTGVLWDYDTVGDIDIVRDDTEIEYSDIPNKIDIDNLKG